MPVTPQIGSKKRDDLIDAALSLFNREGFHCVGIDRILEEAGVAKMTLYKHFGSKDELIAEALRAQHERFVARVAADVEQSAPDPAGRLLALFEVANAWFHEPEFNGCIFLRACSEFADEHPVHDRVRDYIASLDSYVAGLVRGAGFANVEDTTQSVMILLIGCIASSKLRNTRCPGAARPSCDADPARHDHHRAASRIADRLNHQA